MPVPQAFAPQMVPNVNNPAEVAPPKTKKKPKAKPKPKDFESMMQQFETGALKKKDEEQRKKEEEEAAEYGEYDDEYGDYDGSADQ